MQRKVAVALVACLFLEACSSRPRAFTPHLAAPAATPAEFDAAYSTCQQLLVAGKLDSSGRTGSAVAGAAAGAGTAVAGGTAAAAVGGWAGVAAASATVVLLPFAIVGGAWGMSRIKRAKKEQAIKMAMEGCLEGRGFTVASWSRTGKTTAVQSAQAIR